MKAIPETLCLATKVFLKLILNHILQKRSNCKTSFSLLLDKLLIP